MGCSVGNLPFATKCSFGVGDFGITNPSSRSVSLGISDFGETLHWRLSSLETIVINVSPGNKRKDYL